MNKRALRENIETIVRLLPRPQVNDAPLAKANNYWLIVEEYEEGEGIVLLNTITNHEGKIPYDSIREFRNPEMLILCAQVILGKDGEFNFEPFIDAPDDDMPGDTVEILPERVSHAEVTLAQCTPEQRRGIRELLIREKMSNLEMRSFCYDVGIPDGYKFFSNVNGPTSFLDKDGDGHEYRMWIRPGFVPILSKLLLDSQKPSPPAQSS